MKRKLFTISVLFAATCLCGNAQVQSLKLPKDASAPSVLSIDGKTLRISSLPGGARFAFIMLTIDGSAYKQVAETANASVSFELPKLNDGIYAMVVFNSPKKIGNDYKSWIMRNAYLVVAQQEYSLSEYSQAYLNAPASASYLGENEQAVIDEMNKVRANPKEYAEYIRQDRKFYSSDGSLIERPGALPLKTKEGFAAIDECIKALEKAQPAGALKPHKALCQSAQLLAKDQSRKGTTGHTSSNGNNIVQRIHKFDKTIDEVGENCSYGPSEARAIVIQLLVDDGVPLRGHRDNILNGMFSFCGVAIDSHPVFRHVCVIDYAIY
ncbi:hypothetical protein FACS189430_05480 [Bacteroidia bacterium]|nr:hypothetical protein FACS189430_05480 [Bacteroidia bacterium]